MRLFKELHESFITKTSKHHSQCCTMLRVCNVKMQVTIQCKVFFLEFMSHFIQLSHIHFDKKYQLVIQKSHIVMNKISALTVKHCVNVVDLRVLKN